MRPPPRREFDQFPATLNSIISQAREMESSVKGKMVAVLGDHDGLSLLLTRFCSPRKVIVLEFDEFTIGWIKKVADNNNMPIEVVRYDLRSPYAEVQSTIGNIDVVRTDPPYNCAGLECFSTRGAQMLAPSKGELFICLPSGSPDWGQHVLYNMHHKILPTLGFSFVGFSGKPNHYPQIEGASSAFWHYKIQNSISIKDTEFLFEIYHTSEDYCKHHVKCPFYLSCILSREHWKRHRWLSFTEPRLTVST